MVHHPYDQMTNVPNLPLPKMPNVPKRFGNPSTAPRTRFGRFGSFGTFADLGSVSIEMLFFLLIFVVAFFGAVEMAREVSVKHALDVGTYRAARYLSIVPGDQMTARNMIQTELDRNVLGGAGNVVMTVDMPSQSFQTVFSVTAEVAYQPVIPLMVFAPKTLRVVHSQSIEAYP
jgi:hypothetical protein